MFILNLCNIKNSTGGFTPEALNRLCKTTSPFPMNIPANGAVKSGGFVAVFFDVGELDSHMSARTFFIIETDSSGLGKQVMTGEFHNPRKFDDGTWQFRVFGKTVVRPSCALQHFDLICAPIPPVPVPA